MRDPTEETRERIERIRRAIEAGDDHAALDAEIAELHPADLAEIIDLLEDGERVELFRRIPPGMRAETLSEVDQDTWPELLEAVEAHSLRELFENLEVDDAADILGELTSEEAREILSRIEPEGSREIAALMRYDEESAGGVMTTEMVTVPADITADEAIVRVRERGREVADFHTVWVVEDEGRLAGAISLQDLILADGSTLVRDVMRTDLVTVRPNMDQEDVARLIAKYNLVSIPVVDEFGRLLGRITVDDVIDIIEAEATEDIFRLSGVDEEEERYASPAEIIRSRTPWLLITLATASLGAAIVAQFEETIARIAFIAVFMPLVAAMAGNSAVQAMTVAVRRLALSGSAVKPLRSVLRELTAGVVIGLVIAVLVGIGAALWRGDVRVGLVVGGSMWLAVTVAVLWGAAIPILLDRAGLDPAVSSSVFLFTLTDIVSFVVILWAASHFLVQVM
ncbi:MAG TPA: magnesium transporter [Gemmatimonadota bacterium]|nr:magnesium transporter [Gemmatimonadota bacterium]